jgi:hypothetical protein
VSRKTLFLLLVVAALVALSAFGGGLSDGHWGT